LTSRTFREALRVILLLIAHLTLSDIILQSEELLSVAISGTGNIKHMHVVLKMLNVKNVIVHTEWRITDPWLDIVKPIPSLILLERPLQLVYLILTLLSV